MGVGVERGSPTRGLWGGASALVNDFGSLAVDAGGSSANHELTHEQVALRVRFFFPWGWPMVLVGAMNDWPREGRNRGLRTMRPPGRADRARPAEDAQRRHGPSRGFFFPA